jgi:formylglycine-generating enzyme required for sulfatase activity
MTILAANALALLAACVGGPTIEALQQFQDCEECPPMIALPQAPGVETRIAVARHELTWMEYIAAVKQASCSLPQQVRAANMPIDLDKLSDSYPINYLTYSEFNCYLEWISKKTGSTYRLPSGDEWEYAARAGATTRFPWGDEPGFNKVALFPREDVASYGETGWFERESMPKQSPDPNDPRLKIGKDRESYPVESFPPNAWGLYDVIGNVSETTSDTKPGDPKCILKFGQDKCISRAERGGGGYAFIDRNRKVLGVDKNYFQETVWRFREFDQPNGYRIAREIK